MSNSSIATADRMTHLKIVVVALLASVTVMVVGISARPQTDERASVQVMKPTQALLAIRAETTAIR